MDGITSPDTSTASVEVASAPSEAPASATGQSDAVTTEQTPSPEAQSASVNGESPTPQPEIEFPDDAALQQMLPADRQSNWQRLRTAYDSAKTQAAAYAQYQPTIEQIEQMGGFERLQQQAELGQLLFSPVENPQTGAMEYSATPFLERVAAESPGTLQELVMNGLNYADPNNPEETLGHSWFRQLGLDPALYQQGVYQQIRSAEDAKQYLAPTAAPTAEELAAIPEQFRDAYKSLTPKQREELSYADDETKAEFLQDKADALQARQFIAQQQAEREQQRQQYEAQLTERVATRSQELGQQAFESAVASVRQKLESEAKLSASEKTNDRIWSSTIREAAEQVLADPQMLKANEDARKLYELSAHYEVHGDKWKANEYKLQADTLSKTLTNRLRTAAVSLIAEWSAELGGARQAQQQQIQNARPRVELGASSTTANPQTRTKTVGGPREGFGWSAQQMEQYKADIRARQMGQ